MQSVLSSVDVSFISFALDFTGAVLPLAEGWRSVCLIKPQFEAGREKVGKRALCATLPHTGR